MEVAIIFSLIALVFFGIADAVGAYVSRELSATRIMMVDVSINLVIFFVLGWVLSLLDFNLTRSELLYVTGAALGAMSGYVLLMRGLAIGHAGVVVPIANAYAVVSVVLGILVLNETLSLQQFAAIGTVIVGIILLSVDRSSFRKIDRAALYGLGALFSWGLMTFFLDRAAETVPFISIALWNNLIIVLLLSGYFLITRQSVIVPEKTKYYVYSALMGVLLGVGFLSFIYAFSVGSLSIVSVIPAASPFVTAVLAHYFLGDRLNRLQILMIAAIIGGIMLLAW